MIEGGKLETGAIISAVAVLVAMYICKDINLATIAAPSNTKEWMRLRWLKMRGLEEYVGRHRAVLA
jgi:hypothetical protein